MHKRGIVVDVRTVLARELRIQGTMGPVDEFPAAIESLASGRVDAASLISHRFELRAFADALRMAGNPREAGKVMITIGNA
jgi:threonine dehydrogenase-like Zn-dependent dehydrogenase